MVSEIKCFNITFKGLKKEYILYLLRTNSLDVVIPANAELIVMANEIENFREILNKNITTIDGQIPYFFTKLKNKELNIDKISGSDIIFDICNEASKLGLKVFLLGGLKDSNRLSQEHLMQVFPSLIISGYSPPYASYPFSKEHNNNIFNHLKKNNPDIIFVGFGAPKQEYWIEDNKIRLKNLGIRLAVCVGGTFEFVSGKEKRAPKFVQNIGLESLWRLVQNPKRLKRFARNFIFFKYAFR